MHFPTKPGWSSGCALLSLAVLAMNAAPTALAQEKRGCDDRPRLCKLLAKRQGSAGGQEWRATPPADATLRYGKAAKQGIDFWKPASGALRAPLVIFIHGGGWHMGDKSNGTGAAKVTHFTKAGYAFASINYRLIPEVKVEEEPRDVAAAIRHLRGQAEKLGFDPDRIVLMGHSAGAHLAALVATDPAYLGSDLAAIRAVILLDGAGYDVARQLNADGRYMQQTYGRAFGGRSPEQLRALSPVHQAAAPNAAAFQIVHDAKRTASVEQGKLFEAALRAGGSPVERLVVDPGGSALSAHLAINREVGVPGNAQTASMMAFLRKHGLPG